MLDTNYFRLVNTSPEYLTTEELESLKVLLQVKIDTAISRAEEVEQYRSDDVLAKMFRHDAEVFKSILKKIA